MSDRTSFGLVLLVCSGRMPPMSGSYGSQRPAELRQMLKTTCLCLIFRYVHVAMVDRHAACMRGQLKLEVEFAPFSAL